MNGNDVTYFDRFTDFILKGKSLLGTNLFPPNEYEKNDKIILKYLVLTKRLRRKEYCVICGKNTKFKKSKISYIFKKTLVHSVICSK